MRIVMLTNTYLPHVGGVARSVSSLAGWLRSRGHPVLVAAPTFEDMPEREADVVRVPAIQNWNGSDFSVPLPLTGAVHRAVERFEPELVHSHHPFLLGDTALRIAAEFDLPVVFTHHTMYEHYTQYVPLDSPRMKRLAIELGTGYAELCDLVFAPSEAIAAILRERGVETPIEVVPTGVHADELAAGDGAAARARLGIPGDALVVGHVGRLAAEKNLDVLARVIARHLGSHPAAHAIVVGDGPRREAMHACFAENGVEARVHFTGVLEGEGLADAYRAMDVFAFASRTETQGLVLAEALAAGVPVVAIDAPAVDEVVRDGVNGRLLAGGDDARFAEALAWAAAPENRERLRPGIAETARAYSIDATGARALGHYARLRRRVARGAHEDGPWATARRRLEEEWALVAHRAETLRLAWPRPETER